MEKIFTHPDLNELISSGDYAAAAELLMEEQKKHWPLVSQNYELINKTDFKKIYFDGFIIKAQHNPGRLYSTSAKVDSESIKERKCFLCIPNLYKEQKALLYRKDLLFLVNPFPIFPKHFTISDKGHNPQRISGRFEKMLSVSRDINEYVVVYNGPQCGASAPDHFHFQAGSRNFLPIDDEFHSLKNEYGEILTESDSLTVAGIDDGLRRFISIESVEIGVAEKIFDLFYNIYSKISTNDEPLMNIISSYEEESGWRILIFLRAKHRSSHYFRDDDRRILLSPAAVDIGGICILPLQRDFDGITKDIISEIFKEVRIGKEQFDYVKTELKNLING